MAGYEPGCSAYARDAAAPRDGVTVRWQTEIPTRPAARPVVAAGSVFVSTAAGLRAYDLSDGSRQWGLDDAGQSWPKAPVVHDGTVYLGRYDSNGPPLLALDAADGTERWRVDLRGDVSAPPVPAVYGDGDLNGLYVGDDTGRVYKIRPEDGSTEHHVDVFGAVTRLAYGRRLLIGTESGEVYAFYETNDRLQGLWRRKLGGKVTALVDGGGGPYVATFGGPLYRLADGAHAGRTDWTSERGAIELAVTGQDVVGADAGSLGVHHYRTGDQRWQLDGGYGAAPAIAGDLLVAGGGDVGENGSGFVSAYDLRPGPTDGLLGRARWTFETGDAIMEGITVADGAVFAGTQGVDEPAKLYALDPT